MKRNAILTLLALSTIVICSPLVGAEWGNFTGTFLYDGNPPDAPKITPNKDAAFCGRFPLVDESLVVGSSGGIANIIVFLYQRTGEAPPPIHPDYQKDANGTVKLDNKGCRFEPHIVLLRTTQTLQLANSDEVGHNSKIDCFTNTSINPLIPAGAQVDQKFPAPERLPATVSCNIHPWMSARMVVKDNPYMAVTDENGKFVINNVPAGEWTFQFWHEKAGYVQEVNVGGKDEQWSRGRLTVKVAGQTDLGQIKVGPAVFQK